MNKYHYLAENCKAFVFISFAFFGGFFQFQEGETLFGDMNVLKALLDRGCILKEEYDFYDDDEWLTCYERTSGYIEEGIIMIALNEKKIYDCMVDLGMDEDLLEIELQAIITIMHEVGHGIIDWYRYQFKGEETTSELINDIIYCDEDEEEDLCEEFGESWASSYTGVYDSAIAKSLTEYDSVDIA